MALKDWVRHDGYIDSFPGPSNTYGGNEEFIMLVRDIQFKEVHTGAYNRFPTLYDVAIANGNKNYIYVTDNTKLVQDPPNINTNKRY